MKLLRWIVCMFKDHTYEERDYGPLHDPYQVFAAESEPGLEVRVVNGTPHAIDHICSRCGKIKDFRA